MLSNLQTFLSEHCANVHLQTLIAGDPVSKSIVERLNQRSVSAREGEIFEEVVGKRAVNSSLDVKAKTTSTKCTKHMKIK
jgi:hypothetical protein